MIGRVRSDAAVDRFARAMRHELEANSDKGDWIDTPVQAMLESLAYHLAKLAVAVKADNLAGIREFAADVGNEAMMVADLACVLEAAPAGEPVLLRDVVIAPSVGGIVTAWAKDESDEASGISGDLMHAAKQFTRTAQTIGRRSCDGNDVDHECVMTCVICAREADHSMTANAPARP